MFNISRDIWKKIEKNKLGKSDFNHINSNISVKIHKWYDQYTYSNCKLYVEAISTKKLANL